MSNHFEKYKRRVQRNGNDVGEALTNNTIAFIESTFKASPTYRRMEVERTVNGIHETFEMDARVVEIERLGSLREIILRPNDSLEIGTYVRFDGYTWLLYDKYGGTGSMSIKMLAIRCNREVKWVDRNGKLVKYNCVASATDIGSKAKQSKNEIEWNKYDVRLPLGQLFMTLELNEDSKKITLNDRFIFGRNVYEVTGVDDITNVGVDGYGVIQFTIKITTQRDEDDFENEIAWNKWMTPKVEVKSTETNTVSKMTVSQEKEDKGKGGRIW